MSLFFEARKVSSPNAPMSIFEGRKLKPGVYKVQNFRCQTYLDILEGSNDLCCRPATALSPQDALVSLDVLLVSELSTFLTLRSGNFDHPGRDTILKRCA